MSAIQKFSAALSAERMSQLSNKAINFASKCQKNVMNGYHQTRALARGPIRNGFLVGKEFLQLVSKERQFKLPSANLWNNARTEYNQIFERVVPSTMRSQGKWKEAILNWGRELHWKDVGTGALIAAEVLSLYYISKLMVLSGKKTLKTIF